jgi:hypothetical protein
MSTLAGQKVKDKYGNLLHVEGGLTTSLKDVEDGGGNASALSVSTSQVGVDQLLFSTAPATGTSEDILILSAGNVVQKRTIGDLGLLDSISISSDLGPSNITIGTGSTSVSFVGGAGISTASDNTSGEVTILNTILFSDPVGGTNVPIQSPSGKLYLASGDNVTINFNAASSTITFSAVNIVTEQLIGITSAAINLGSGNNAKVVYSAINNTSETASYHFGTSPAKLGFDVALTDVENVSGSQQTVEVDMSAIVEVSSPNSDIIYTLERWNGSAWSTVASYTRTKSSTGLQVDSFWGTFELASGNKLRVDVSSSTGGVSLSAGSAFKFTVKDHGNII